eukprot:TRINITY_DN39963_c0_g1_i1.p1 TRINITY_DN39963_c0_g1~~TRINITY_DN39963_c0_g1_i1.p1  ORF type:complete len:1122 (+),score=265.11 TRINITY_DN39963_c0_g1_i1:87-3452(+)
MNPRTPRGRRRVGSKAHKEASHKPPTPVVESSPPSGKGRFEILSPDVCPSGAPEDDAFPESWPAVKKASPSKVSFTDRALHQMAKLEQDEFVQQQDGIRDIMALCDLRGVQIPEEFLEAVPWPDEVPPWNGSRMIMLDPVIARDGQIMSRFLARRRPSAAVVHQPRRRSQRRRSSASRRPSASSPADGFRQAQKLQPAGDLRFRIQEFIEKVRMDQAADDSDSSSSHWEDPGLAGRQSDEPGWVRTVHSARYEVGLRRRWIQSELETLQVKSAERRRAVGIEEEQGFKRIVEMEPAERRLATALTTVRLAREATEMFWTKRRRAQEKDEQVARVSVIRGWKAATAKLLRWALKSKLRASAAQRRPGSSHALNSDGGSRRRHSPTDGSRAYADEAAATARLIGCSSTDVPNSPGVPQILEGRDGTPERRRKVSTWFRPAVASSADIGTPRAGSGRRRTTKKDKGFARQPTVAVSPNLGGVRRATRVRQAKPELRPCLQLATVLIRQAESPKPRTPQPLPTAEVAAALAICAVAADSGESRQGSGFAGMSSSPFPAAAPVPELMVTPSFVFSVSEEVGSPSPVASAHRLRSDFLTSDESFTFGRRGSFFGEPLTDEEQEQFDAIWGDVNGDLEATEGLLIGQVSRANAARCSFLGGMPGLGQERKRSMLCRRGTKKSWANVGDRVFGEVARARDKRRGSMAPPTAAGVLEIRLPDIPGVDRTETTFTFDVSTPTAAVAPPAFTATPPASATPPAFTGVTPVFTITLSEVITAAFERALRSSVWKAWARWAVRCAWRRPAPPSDTRPLLPRPRHWTRSGRRQAPLTLDCRLDPGPLLTLSSAAVFPVKADVAGECTTFAAFPRTMSLAASAMEQPRASPAAAPDTATVCSRLRDNAARLEEFAARATGADATPEAIQALREALAAPSLPASMRSAGALMVRPHRPTNWEGLLAVQEPEQAPAPAVVPDRTELEPELLAVLQRPEKPQIDGAAAVIEQLRVDASKDPRARPTTPHRIRVLLQGLRGEQRKAYEAARCMWNQWEDERIQREEREADEQWRMQTLQHAPEIGTELPIVTEAAIPRVRRPVPRPPPRPRCTRSNSARRGKPGPRPRRAPPTSDPFPVR